MFFLAQLAIALATLVVAVLGGLGSAWYMVEKGSRLTTERQGPWRLWTAAGKLDADPYTRAHVARSGRLPIGATSAHYYVAESDGDGRRLAASCEYLIEGIGPDALWWSLAAYDRHGMLFRNEAQRYAYNSAAVMRSASGVYQIQISNKARPGNWLPVSGGGPMSLVLRVYEPRRDDEAAAAAAEQRAPKPAARRSQRLPTITRVGCR
jgi:hypothetical protein